MPTAKYRLADGTPVPGVTTVLGVLNKPALVAWANRLGLQGIDSTKYVDSKARIGTLAHYIVEAYLKGEKADYGGYTAVEIDQAENSALSYFEWERGHAVKPILCEAPLVSQIYAFGGTPDCLADVDGVLTLLDFKTGKAIYDEYGHQVAAYDQLFRENGHEPKDHMILRIGREEDEGFEVRHIAHVDTHWQVFQHALAIYELQRELKWNGQRTSPA